ncbi:hypothetical protein CDL12_10518 [Handroanthus impetiginosus]|uniref:DUF247 domain-containing protein n=1 Tax=Handroanthus impetiginosus TaxID=429701 RepID=A0A2G9HH39_9LAMI|nr:hypothetical protein CDL12_10518 [Handroanthus impetiginosus]
MGNDSVGEKEPNDHVIKIWQVDKERLTSMEENIADSPRILRRSAGKSCCCIFRVPQSLVEVNGRCYQPYVVSIGPYHHGDPRLRMIEEHKWRFLGSLLKRIESKGLKLKDLLESVHPLESKARECYSANINFSTDEFIEILVLDGCFVIELFRKFGGIIPFEADDPLLSLDLIRIENQIPFFVLECLFDLTLMPGEESGPNLSTLTFKFFNNSFYRPEEFFYKFRDLKGKHLLDLLRTSFIPEGYEEPRQSKYTNTHVIPCISKLRRAGIRLKPTGKDESFLAIRFRHRALEMPTITIDDFMSSFLLNCVAYEQCHRHCSKHMTTYATFLSCLINTAKEVQYSCDMNIIENYVGTDAEIAMFINNLGKDVSFDIEMCYLSELFNEVEHYYMNSWHVQWASFRYTYFNLAAFVLLVLTVAQTTFTILGYVRPPP